VRAVSLRSKVSISLEVIGHYFLHVDNPYAALSSLWICTAIHALRNTRSVD